MIIDSNAINGFNPFVVGEMSLPGAWDQPYNYNEGSVSRTITNGLEKKEPLSPICEYARTAGDGTIDMCDPQVPNCKDDTRPLYPRRLIDPGFTRCSKCSKCGTHERVPSESIDMKMWVLVLIALALFFMVAIQK